MSYHYHIYYELTNQLTSTVNQCNKLNKLKVELLFTHFNLKHRTYRTVLNYSTVRNKHGRTMDQELKPNLFTDRGHVF